VGLDGGFDDGRDRVAVLHRGDRAGEQLGDEEGGGQGGGQGEDSARRGAQVAVGGVQAGGDARAQRGGSGVSAGELGEG
jgi:hypothetical protein